MKPKRISYEVIAKAVKGDTAALLTVQEHYKPYIAYLSNGNADLKDLLNSKLLESCFEISVRLSAAGEVAKPRKAVKGQDERLRRP